MIGVGADDAVIGFTEEIIELVHGPGRAHPAEAVGLERYAGLEAFGEVLTDWGVDAVSGDDQIAVGEAFFQCGGVDGAGKMQVRLSLYTSRNPNSQ